MGQQTHWRVLRATSSHLQLSQVRTQALIPWFAVLGGNVTGLGMQCQTNKNDQGLSMGIGCLYGQERCDHKQTTSALWRWHSELSQAWRSSEKPPRQRTSIQSTAARLRIMTGPKWGSLPRPNSPHQLVRLSAASAWGKRDKRETRTSEDSHCGHSCDVRL